MKTYRPNDKSFLFLLAGLFVMFSVLTFSLYVETDFSDSSKNLGLAVFWLFFLFFLLFPFVFKVVVDNRSVKSYFLGILLVEAGTSNLKSIEYKNVKIGFYGSIKVLKIRIKQGSTTKSLNLGEGFYSKEAIAHVMEVLK